MRPSHYNYLKRMWTRNFFNKKEKIISKIIFFPFRILILVTITIIYAGFIFLFLVIQIIVKFIYEMLRILFIFLMDLVIGFIKILKKRNKTYIKKEEKPLLYQIENYIKERGCVDIASIQRKFKISYTKTIELINELEIIEK